MRLQSRPDRRIQGASYLHLHRDISARGRRLLHDSAADDRVHDDDDGADHHNHGTDDDHGSADHDRRTHNDRGTNDHRGTDNDRCPWNGRH